MSNENYIKWQTIATAACSVLLLIIASIGGYLATRVMSFDEKLGSINVNVEAMRGDQKTMSFRLKNIEDDVSDITGEIDDIDGRVKQLEDGR